VRGLGSRRRGRESKGEAAVSGLWRIERKVKIKRGQHQAGPIVSEDRDLEKCSGNYFHLLKRTDHAGSLRRSYGQNVRNRSGLSSLGHDPA
jgi:hypothetical protein